MPDKPIEKPVRLMLSEADHDEIRVVAAKERKTMARWAKDAVLAALKAATKGEAK